MLSGANYIPSRNQNGLRKLKNPFASTQNFAEVGDNHQDVVATSSSSTFKAQNESFAFGLYSVALSDSIRSLETLSPGLYNWIHAGDYGPKANLRFFSPSGHLITDSLPKHLTEIDASPAIPARGKALSAEEQMFSATPISRGAADNQRKQARKPVLSSSDAYAATHSSLAPPAEVKRFFLNVMELELNKNMPNVEQVICIITMSKQKRTTSCLPLGKSPNASKSSAVSAICMESFIFDVPKGQGDIIISILVYSRSVEQASYRSGGMVASSSTLSLSSNTSSNPVMSSINFLSSTLKRSGTVSSVNHISNFDRARHQAEAGDIGVFLADLTVIVPSGHAFGKIDGWHPLTINKKTIGRLQLQMGMYSDYDYIPMPEVPSEFIERLAHLNFSLLTRGGLIWDRKWVEASPDGFFVYSAEYRTTKSAIAWIPFSKLIAVAKASFDEMAWPHALVLSIALPWKDDTSVFMPTPLSSRWKDEVVEAGKLEGFVVNVYVAADTEEMMQRWLAFLSCHINRHHKRQL